MSILKYAICHLSLVPVRAESSDKSEIVTYLLFGECITILNTQGSWCMMRMETDGYEGWIDIKQCKEVSYSDYLHAVNNYHLLGIKVSQDLVIESKNEVMRLLTGSRVPVSDSTSFSIGDIVYSFSEAPVIIERESVDDLISNAKFFLNSPYLWGGRSLFGIDCSGFTQMVFRLSGIFLKRDASQQAEQGKVVDFLSEARAGDLAFFDNLEGRIIHVGIMLSSSEIIHASGRVKIDRIDDEGIFSTDLNKYSHKLRIIKRYDV